MNSKNVALVFAPTLIHSKGPTNVTKEFADMPRAITVVQFLIEESEKLFPTSLPDNVLDIVEVNPPIRLVSSRLASFRLVSPRLVSPCLANSNFPDNRR